MIEKLRNKLFYNVIWQSILFTFGMCFLIIGLFYNYDRIVFKYQYESILLIAVSLLFGSFVFMFVIIYICIKLNSTIKMKEHVVSYSHSEYDTNTNLMYADFFYKKVKDYTLVSTEPACLVAFHVEHIEQLYRNRETLESKIANFTNVLLPGKQDTFYSASKSNNQYLVFIYGYDKTKTLERIDALQQALKTELQNILTDDSLCIVNCGYTWYPYHGKTINELVTNTNFALFEAVCFNKEEKNEFTPSSFQKQKLELKRNDRFDKLLSTNSFHYHFQPIISAKNGDIYAYEALMRSDESIGLSPIEILEIAQRQKRLYEIEYYTFYNTLKYYKENLPLFNGKYLFINCLPNQLLTKEHFDILYKKYHTITHNIVIEASENYVQTEENHLLLTERLHTLGAKLALDDYGSGYANEVNLLKYSPRYIKIDKSLISNIDNDEKKRYLVSNIIQFAKLHGMISLAEGIETFKELQTVIFLGVDLMQGFYLYRPSPELVSELPKKLKDEIAAINLKFLKSTANSETYIADSNTSLNLDILSKGNYSTVVLNTEKLRVFGNSFTEHILTITIPDNSNLTLELENINIRGKDEPCIILGRNCHVDLKLIGDNCLTHQGILVPESSTLSITGDGNLTIHADTKDSIGIGSSGTYGTITIQISGKLTITTRNENAICIGGQRGTIHSKIKLLGGKFLLCSDGVNAIGVGCVDGQANIELGKINMVIKCNGTSSIGIGCINGGINLSSNADITIKQTGQNSCCIGVLSNQKGNILLHNSIIHIKLNASAGCAIGSIKGSIYIKLAVHECICHIQGIHMCGIGNYAGSGVTEIQKGTISVKMASAHKLYLGSQNGPLLINGGNIDCPINRIVKPINKYRIPLHHYRFTDRETFKEHIEIDNLAYDYEAYTTDRVKDLNVYLPEFREYEQFLCS